MRRREVIALKVVDLPLAELTPHPRNYRSHGDRQLAELQASLRQYGWARNVVVASDKVILAGHGIVEAARLNGLKMAPCEVLKIPSTDPKAEKFLALENTVSRLAEDDDTQLAALLADVQRTEGLEGTGYSDAELDALIASVAVPQFPPTSADEQGRLDELAPMPVTCPECGHEFDARKANAAS